MWELRRAARRSREPRSRCRTPHDTPFVLAVLPGIPADRHATWNCVSREDLFNWQWECHSPTPDCDVSKPTEPGSRRLTVSTHRGCNTTNVRSRRVAAGRTIAVARTGTDACFNCRGASALIEAKKAVQEPAAKGPKEQRGMHAPHAGPYAPDCIVLRGQALANSQA